MKDLNEADLIEATVEGDRDAYTVLVERYAGDIFATCMGITADVEDAKDVSQETFMRGFMRIGQLRKRNSFRPWIIGIARNLCLDHLRRKKKRDVPTRSRSDMGYEIPDNYLDIHEALARLPEKYRLPLLMYYFDGRSSDGVAEALNISRDGVLTRLSRGRMELRRIMTSRESDNERRM